jgi:LacI family transcriptional regulator
MATLADVARRAGVSAATASRVINGSAKPVAEALREAVLRAVADLHYVPNAHAQLLARSDRVAVGVIVHDVSDPYFAEITRGLQKVAGEHGRLCIICNSYRDPERELAYVDLLRAQQVAAIILTGSGYHDPAFTRALSGRLRAYERTGGRVAVIGRHPLAGDAVLPANTDGGYLAGAELFRLGHKRIGVVAGPRVLTTTTDRIAGLRRAAKEFGRTVPASRVVYANFDRDSAASATAELLDRSPTITAVAALNDAMAIGALAALRERGILVPQQMSVIGFDDMPIAADLHPPLSTIHLGMPELGMRAMALVLGPPSPEPRIEHTPVTLIRRASTGPPLRD